MNDEAPFFLDLQFLRAITDGSPIRVHAPSYLNQARSAFAPFGINLPELTFGDNRLVDSSGNSVIVRVFDLDLLDFILMRDADALTIRWPARHGDYPDLFMLAKCAAHWIKRVAGVDLNIRQIFLPLQIAGATSPKEIEKLCKVEPFEEDVLPPLGCKITVAEEDNLPRVVVETSAGKFYWPMLKIERVPSGAGTGNAVR